ncbi:MAG TPA: EAL domain-containing protein [Steroidobacteraceae bacterium]|nr:EAL domain-containing protein [Steroidobacteraceae bacterium]
MGAEPATTGAIRILQIEDSETDAELAAHQLKRAAMPCVLHRVDTEAALREALASFGPALILSDFDMPGFDGYAALRIARELAPEIPFIFLSGKMGEDRAIDALHRGAVDYVLKSNLSRLVPAVRRAVQEAAVRRRQAMQIARLDRVLRMLSGVNAAVVRIRDRVELLRESCRLAVTTGGYAAVVASAKIGGSPVIQPAAWHGVDETLADAAREVCAAALAQGSGAVTRAIRTRQAVVCNDTAGAVPADFNGQMHAAGLCSLVALPLLVDDTAVGVLLLAARDAGVVGEEELRMLREVAGNLSFAWQYMQKDTTVRFLSHFDAQTGLAKRTLFRDRLAGLLANASEREARYAVTVLDVERLGLINDSFGRRTGDLLLQHLAARLKRHMPATEQVAHFGGGTFALVENYAAGEIAGLSAAAGAHAAALTCESISIEQRDIPVAMRAGVALHPQDGRDAEALLQHAEAALLHARAAGAAHLHYDAQRQSRRVGELALEHRLRLALERNEFELFYQPKVNVITRRIQGVEALIRWRDPKAGLMPPAAFLPVVEACGLAVDVGSWVIAQAARDCHEWQHAGLPPVRVAVNVFPAQLQRADFTARFMDAVQSWASHTWGLDIELTEGVFDEDSDTEIQKLKLLRKSGVRIAIDDFGTGYSSLRRLSAMPVNTLKIDGCFIGQVPADAAGKAVVKTIVALARAFNMTTVAEGVENQEQLDFLWQVGCDQSQGYLHSPPIPRDQFVNLLQHGNGHLILPAEAAEAAEGVEGAGSDGSGAPVRLAQ